MTINEIAKLAGVSVSTVSKIVNNKAENININTRNRVLEIVKEYHYVPYATAKKASEAKTFILGVLLRSAQRTSQLINGIMNTAQENGYSILLLNSNENVSTELKHISALCKNKVDGVIWEPVSENSLQAKHHFEKSNISVCYMNAPFAEASYNIDFAALGYAAAKALIQKGHQKLGCLVTKNDTRSDLVLEGFKRCLFDHKIAYVDNMCLDTDSDEWHNRLISHSLSGIVSAHYSAAATLSEQLAAMRLKLPHDISLITLCSDPQENIGYPRISCIQIPYALFGRVLCEKLIAECEKQECSHTTFTLDFQPDSDVSIDVPFFSFSKKIVVIGSINIDITLNVDELPQPGKSISTDRYSVIPGGKGANQAVGVAKLGNEVCLIGKVGSDYDASIVYSCMEKNHVDYHGVLRDAHSETGKAYIHVQNDGESMITILNGANKNLSPSDILPYEELFVNAGYCLLQTEVPTSAVQAAAEIAHRHGVQNILKPAAIKTISDELMQLTDIFVPNKKEAEILCPQINDIEGKADAFLARGARSVIITLGESGCYIKTADFCSYLPAADFTPIDTTGAADAFIAALAVYLSAGYSIEHAARVASCAAGFCVSRQGTIPALIDRNSLEAYIRRTQPEILLP